VLYAAAAALSVALCIEVAGRVETRKAENKDLGPKSRPQTDTMEKIKWIRSVVIIIII